MGWQKVCLESADESGVSIPEPIQTDAVWEVMSQLEFENTGLRLDLEPPGSGDDPAGLAFQVSPMIPTGSHPVSLLPLVCARVSRLSRGTRYP